MIDQLYNFLNFSMQEEPPAEEPSTGITTHRKNNPQEEHSQNRYIVTAKTSVRYSWRKTDL